MKNQTQHISRRSLLKAIPLTAAGVMAACAAPAAAPSAPAAPATESTAAPAATTAPAAADATPAAQASTGTRGQGGTLKLIWWQGPAILNPHLSSGSKDQDASRVVYEPLASFNKAGELIPFLAAEIPTKDNGGVAADGKSVTWKLKTDVKWSDGQPFTAEDVKFTFEYLSNKETAATTASNVSAVESVEVIDPATIKLNFKNITPAWATPFVGINGQILPQHIFKDFIGAKSREAPANLKPVGTGAYQVVEFKPGDIVIYEANPNFREADKPFFGRIELKGGGDATSAARAVLQTGDYDFAWNLQVEASVLKQLEGGGKGVIALNPGGTVEQLFLNRADPNKEVDGERASVTTPHPFFTDEKVRKAFALAVDRKTIAEQLYGPAGSATSNIVVAPPQFVSPNTSFEFDLEKSKALLEDAGYTAGADGVRQKGDVRLAILLQTSVNPVRQKTQEIIKQGLESVGFKVELKSVDSTVYFSSSPTNLDDINHFYADAQFYSTGSSNPDPGDYLSNWLSTEIAQKSNQWSGNNFSRWANPEYDQLFAEAETELDPEKRRLLLIQLNDIVVNDGVVIPLVQRNFPNGASNTLDGIDLTPWDSSLWQVKDWTRKA